MCDDIEIKVYISSLNDLKFTHNEIPYHAQGDEPNNLLVSLDTLGVDKAGSMISQGYEHL
jgi:hypothetical protein